MTSVRLDLAYHGAGFAGWAAQPGKRTVQGELEGALERILGGSTPLTVAGRTDAGVHAWAQVASFVAETEPPGELARALNSHTGHDLVVQGGRPGGGLRRAPRCRLAHLLLPGARRAKLQSLRGRDIAVLAASCRP